MSNTSFMLVDGNTVITFDPSLVTKVQTFESGTVSIQGYDCVFAQFNALTNPDLYEQVIELFKQSERYQVLDLREKDAQEEVNYSLSYKIKTQGPATHFTLMFPDEDSQLDAFTILAEDDRLEVKTWTIFKYSLSVEFAPYYDDYAKNKQVIIDALGEPEE